VAAAAALVETQPIRVGGCVAVRRLSLGVWRELDDDNGVNKYMDDVYFIVV
jgi:hypothetical protein